MHEPDLAHLSVCSRKLANKEAQAKMPYLGFSQELFCSGSTEHGLGGQ